jgi:hypothetical protein
VFSGLATVASAANATPSWSIVSTPTLADAGLSAVSCPSAASCFAVGIAFARTSQTVISHWDGSRWSIMTSPNPAGAVDPFFGGVSCPTTTSCFATGSAEYGVNRTARTLIEHWNGSRWSIVNSPDPSGSTSAELHGVSCHSSSSCFAVGSYTAGEIARPLVERWNGSSWSITPSVEPAGASYVSVDWVSCAATTSGVAVGSYLGGGTDKTLTERWNGGIWSVSSSPNPSGAISASLNGVSCHGTTSCFAVGSWGGRGATITLIEHWDGTRWSIMTSPSAGVDANSLTGVSCTARTSCFAVGVNSARALIERYR